MLEALEPEIGNMQSTPAGFIREQCDKLEQYKDLKFLSIKQFNWIVKLYEEHTDGKYAHLPLTSRGAREDLLGDD